jgi:hypothetical protein
MIRLWRDSTAPRRLGRARGEQRRLDTGALDTEAEGVHTTSKRSHRIGPFG